MTSAWCLNDEDYVFGNHVANREMQRRTNQFGLANDLVGYKRSVFLLFCTEFINSNFAKAPTSTLTCTHCGALGQSAKKVFCKTDPPTRELTKTLFGGFYFLFSVILPKKLIYFLSFFY